MATKQIPLYSDTAGVIVANDATAAASTLVMRDASGNTVHAQCQATELKTTGTLALAAKSTQTTSVTLDASATVWPFDASGGALAPVLPAVAGVPNRRYTVIKVDSSGNAVTLTGNGAETINGSNTKALASQWSTTTVQANAAGTAWYIVG